MGTIIMSIQNLNGSPHDPQKLVVNYLNMQGIALVTDEHIPVIIYNSDRDAIITPPDEYYSSLDEYYNELFIELIQSTCHPSRVGTINLNPEDDQQYIEYEFIGVIGACMLSSITGIRRDALKCYIIRSFNRFINDNPSLIALFVSHAEKAVKLILEGGTS